MANRVRTLSLLSGLLPLLFCPSDCIAADAREAVLHRDLPDPQFHFNTFIVSWGSTTTPQFYELLKAVRPEIVQVGFYGPNFHGYSGTPGATGYPMQLPTVGERENLRIQKEVNNRIHALGLKVVAHFEVSNVIASPTKWDNFLEWYDKQWPADLLGEKPHPDVRELLQRDASGQIPGHEHYVDFVSLCISSPYARQMLKQMLKLAIQNGVDGVITIYNYRRSCACPYCQSEFKKYLAARFTPQELRERFGIADLQTQKFPEIKAEIPGYPDPNTATPLDWEAMRWGARSFKEAFDEVFIDYGRRLKPDLIVATWDHVGHLSYTDERAFTPIELWGLGENYFWYSGGYGATSQAGNKLNDGWLVSLYVREMGGGKPFVLGKYEPICMRVSLAEAAATGGGGMGLYHSFLDPLAYELDVRYQTFLRKNQSLYWPTEPVAELALILPRQSALNGHVEGWGAFYKLGCALLDSHVLLNVVADQKLTPERLARYPAAVLPIAWSLSEAQCTILQDYVRQGGKLLLVGEAAQADQNGKPRPRPGLFGLEHVPAQVDRQELGQGCVRWFPTVDETALLAALQQELRQELSRFDAPKTVKMALYRQRGRMVLHLVNYDRDEAKAKALNGPAAECPVPAENLGVSLRLPAEARVKKVTLLSPDDPKPLSLAWEMKAGRVEFRVPSILVYGVVAISLAR